LSQPLLSVKEVSSFLSVHPKTLYKWTDEGKIPHLKINGLIRFKKKEIEDWQEKNKGLSLVFSEFLPKLDLSLESYDRMHLKGGKSALGKNSRRWNYGFGTVYQRETKQGKTRWYIDFKDGGRRIRQVVRNAQTRGQVVIALNEKVAKAFETEHGITCTTKKIKFAVLADQYLNDYAKISKRSWRSDRYRIEANLKPYFGDLTLQDISPLLIEKYRAARLKAGVSRSTVNRETTLLKKMLNLAIDWGLTERNPVLKVRLFSEKGAAKERILFEEEEVKLLAQCPDYLRPIVITALNTGMRRGEILNLRWRNVDLKRRLIKVDNTKSGASRIIPVNGSLYSELVKVKDGSGKAEYVFSNLETGLPYTQVRKSFKNSCRKAGVKELRFHDLRHTFATRLIESGADLITVRDLLGHFSVRVTQRYTHPNQDRKKEAVELLVTRAEKQAENSEKLAHICHISETEKTFGSVTRLFSLN
jgi:excisionase family DNA binding protein